MEVMYGFATERSVGVPLPAQSLDQLTGEEKCLLAVKLHGQYHIQPLLLSQGLSIPERVILQSIRSKDYGLKNLR